MAVLGLSLAGFALVVGSQEIPVVSSVLVRVDPCIARRWHLYFASSQYLCAEEEDATGSRTEGKSSHSAS